MSSSNPRIGHLSDKRITLFVGGSIAAFKAAALTSLLVKSGAEVEVGLTDAGRRFVGDATFMGLTGRATVDGMFDRQAEGELHVRLGLQSDLLLLAPTTADTLARLATGRAEDLLSAAVLCARCPVLVAPAMHPAMWANAATQRNARLLSENGLIEFVGPVEGEVATGEVGVGRMAEPEAIFDAVLQRLNGSDLAGRHIVVSAGPTLEDIDPVRFIGNRSSGKMGYAIADRARRRGAVVTLISGPTSLPAPAGVERVCVRTALQMQSAITESLGKDPAPADALIMSAAVGDWRADQQSDAKLKRRPGEGLELRLVPNPDVLASVAEQRRCSRPVLVGFAVETGDDSAVIASARGKLERKGVDMIVGNRASESFGLDDNRAVLVTRDSERHLPRQAKPALADEILDWIAARLTEGH